MKEITKITQKLEMTKMGEIMKMTDMMKMIVCQSVYPTACPLVRLPFLFLKPNRRYQGLKGSGFLSGTNFQTFRENSLPSVRHRISAYPNDEGLSVPQYICLPTCLSVCHLVDLFVSLIRSYSSRSVTEIFWISGREYRGLLSCGEGVK